MKKFYFFALATFFAFGVSAQISYDLELNLNTPASGATVDGSVLIDVDFTLTNNGPDAIPMGDTVFFAYADGSLTNLFSLTNVAGQASGFILAADLTSGGTLNATTDLGGPFSFDVTAFPNGETVNVICLGAGSDALGQTGDAEELNLLDNIDSFTLSQTGGLEEESTQFVVYPVPATDVLNVKSDKAVVNITVMGMDGKVVASASNTNQINVSTLDSGMYVYLIETSNGSFMKNTFVKQ